MPPRTDEELLNILLEGTDPQDIVNQDRNVPVGNLPPGPERTDEESLRDEKLLNEIIEQDQSFRERITPGIPRSDIPRQSLSDQTKRFGQAVGRAATDPDVIVPTGLGIAGGVLGGVPGAIGGAALGGAITEIEEILEEKRKLGEPTPIVEKLFPGLIGTASKVLRATNDPEKSLRVLKNATFEGAIEAASMGIPRVVGKGKTFIHPKLTLTPGIQEVEEELAKFGLTPTLAQKTESQVADLVEGIVEAGYISRPIIQNVKTNQKKAVEMWSENIARSFNRGLKENLTQEQIDTVLKESVDFGKSAQKEISDRLYNEVDNLTGGEVTTVNRIERIPIRSKHPTRARGLDPPGQEPFTGVPQFEQRVISERKVIGGVKVRTDDIKNKVFEMRKQTENIKNADLRGSARTFINAIEKAGDEITFRESKVLRTMANDLAKSNDGTARSVGKRLTTIIKKSMDDAADRLKPEAKEAFDRASAFFREGNEVFENRLLASLMADDIRSAEALGEKLFKNPKSANIDKIKSALDRAAQISDDVNKEELDRLLKSGYAKQLFNKYTKPIVGEEFSIDFNFNGMLSELNDENQKRILNRLLSPKEIEELKRFARVGAFLDKKAARGAMMQLVQASAVFGGFAGLATGRIFPAINTLIGALGVPAIMGRIVTSPKAVKFLTEGAQEMSKGTKEGIRNGISLVTRISKELLEEKAEKANFDLNEFLKTKIERQETFRTQEINQ